VSFFLTSDFCVLKSLFVIVEREWSDRLKAGLEFRWFVPGAGRRLDQGAESDRNLAGCFE